MDIPSLPEDPKAAFGEAVVLHDNLENPVNWSKAAFGVPIKTTDSMTLFFCLEGKVQLMVETEERTLGSGDVILNRSGTMGLVLSMSEDIRFLMVAMNADFYFPILESQALSGMLEQYAADPVRHLSPEVLDECRDLYLMLRRNLLRGQGQLFLHSYTKCMLETLCFLVFSNYRQPSRKGGSYRQIELYNRFLALLHRHYFHERSLAFYASELCVTPRYLSRIILSESGFSAADHIDKVVMDEAKRLIRSHRYSMLQISEMLNFSSPSLFGRYFKAHTGITPKKFEAGL